MQVTTNNLVLVTGATGFIGSRLAQRLLNDGYAVRVLVRDPEKLTASLRDQCEVVASDLLDTETLARAVRDVDVVFHCAANVSTWDTHDAYYSANVLGVKNLLQAIINENPGLSRLVHVSTVDVYGFPVFPCDETSKTNGAGFGYGETKLLGENLVKELGDKAGVSYAIIRPCNVIGPGSQFIARIGAELNAGIMLTVDGGSANAGLVYIDNLVDVLIWAGKSEVAHRECYNVRDDYNIDWATFMDKLRTGINGKGLVVNLSFSVADRIARMFETVHKLFIPHHEPMLHRLLVRFFGRSCGHSAEKIRAHYVTRIGFDEALKNSTEWFLVQAKSK
jgi:nucleoside-diphosphate-sugar epimerase